MRNLILMIFFVSAQSNALEISDCMQIIDLKDRSLCVDDVTRKQTTAQEEGFQVYNCKNPDGTTTISFNTPCKNGGGALACEKPEAYYQKQKSAGTDATEARACIAKLRLLEQTKYDADKRTETINEESRKIADAKAAGLFIVDYEVIGPERASLTYTNQHGSIEQRDVNPPWNLRLTEPSGFHVYISAQNKSNDRSLIVRFSVNGVQVKTAHSTTKYGIATASGRL